MDDYKPLFDYSVEKMTRKQLQASYQHALYTMKCFKGADMALAVQLGNLREVHKADTKAHLEREKDFENWAKEVNSLNAENRNFEFENQVQQFVSEMMETVTENLRQREAQKMADKVEQLKSELERTKQDLMASSKKVKQLKTTNETLEQDSKVKHVLSRVVDILTENHRQIKEQKIVDKVEELQSEVERTKLDLVAGVERTQELISKKIELEAETLKRELSFESKYKRLKVKGYAAQRTLREINRQLKREIQEVKARLPPPRKTWSIDDDQSGVGALHSFTEYTNYHEIY